MQQTKINLLQEKFVELFYSALGETISEAVNSAVNSAVDAAFKKREVEINDYDRRLTRRELCDRWHISLVTLDTYVKDGKIEPIKLGRRVVFNYADVLAAEANGVRRYGHN